MAAHTSPEKPRKFLRLRGYFLAAAFLTVVILHEAIGVVLFALAAVAYLLATGLGRAIIAQGGWLPRWTGPSAPQAGETARCLVAAD